MDLQFLGGTGTVSGSKYLLRSGLHQILIDCGLFQGYKQLRLRNWAPLPVDPHTLDGVILTHAHIDHSGYLPLLVRNGFSGKIWCTRATLELCRVLLPDSARLQEEEAEYANRRGFSKHKPALPLYTEADAQRCLKHFSPIDYRRDIDLGQGVIAQLLPAGHLLGAAMVKVHGPQGSVLFSGDLGRPNDVVMKPPVTREEANYLVLESTYGNRSHPDEDPSTKLADVITRTVKRKGVVIIPSFAVGRAQALLYLIARLHAAGRIPDVPVFLNSPMAVDATAIYRNHPDEHRLSAAECGWLSENATFVRGIEESKALNARRGPMVIIAGSGMATGGRVVHHLKAFAGNPRTSILFTGYQAGGTRGASIMAGADKIKIHGAYIPVRAEVAMLDSLSAHADADEILGWLKTIASSPRKTFIVHGEPLAADALRLRIAEELGWDVMVPEHMERVKLA